jgi:hypothetical protein
LNRHTTFSARLPDGVRLRSRLICAQFGPLLHAPVYAKKPLVVPEKLGWRNITTPLRPLE